MLEKQFSPGHLLCTTSVQPLELDLCPNTRQRCLGNFLMSLPSFLLVSVQLQAGSGQDVVGFLADRCPFPDALTCRRVCRCKRGAPEGGVSQIRVAQSLVENCQIPARRGPQKTAPNLEKKQKHSEGAQFQSPQVGVWDHEIPTSARRPMLSTGSMDPERPTCKTSLITLNPALVVAIRFVSL
eukprot:scaffold178498_cov16-Tisochrysis_lutea.AAC.1